VGRRTRSGISVGPCSGLVKAKIGQATIGQQSLLIQPRLWLGGRRLGSYRPETCIPPSRVERRPLSETAAPRATAKAGSRRLVSSRGQLGRSREAEPFAYDVGSLPPVQRYANMYLPASMTRCAIVCRRATVLNGSYFHKRRRIAICDRSMSPSLEAATTILAALSILSSAPAI
jgi:hypothetical protein